MGAGTSASTYIRQGATGSCNVTSLATGATAISFIVNHLGGLSIDFGDGLPPEYYYNRNNAQRRTFSRTYTSTGIKNIKMRGNVNLINYLANGIGGAIQTQPAFSMTQEETIKLKSLANITVQDISLNIVFDTTKLPNVMEKYYNTGINQSYGSLGTPQASYLPPGITEFTDVGATGHTGSISLLPRGMTKLTLGTNSNVTGSIDNLPPTLRIINIPDLNSGITGSIENLPLGIETVFIYGKTAQPNAQIISGDLGRTYNDRPNLSSFAVRGANTITCNLSTFLLQAGAVPTNISIRGNCTVSGDLQQIPLIVRQFSFADVTFNLSGNIRNIPNLCTYFYISGSNSLTITGDVADLAQKAVTYFLINTMQNTVGGNFTNVGLTLDTLNVTNGSISGNIGLLGSNTRLSNLQLVGGTGIITGNVASIGNRITNIWVQGVNVLLSGDIAQIPFQVVKIRLNKGNFSYTTKVWPAAMVMVEIVSNTGAGNFLTTQMVDQLLIDLSMYATSWSGDKEILLANGNQPRSNNSTVNAAVALLQSRGVRVVTAP